MTRYIRCTSLSDFTCAIGSQGREIERKGTGKRHARLGTRDSERLRNWKLSTTGIATIIITSIAAWPGIDYTVMAHKSYGLGGVGGAASGNLARYSWKRPILPPIQTLEPIELLHYWGSNAAPDTPRRPRSP